MHYRRILLIAVAGAVMTVGRLGYHLAANQLARAAWQPQIRAEAEPSPQAETATPPVEVEPKSSIAPLGTPTPQAAVFSSDTQQAEPTATPVNKLCNSRGTTSRKSRCFTRLSVTRTTSCRWTSRLMAPWSLQAPRTGQCDCGVQPTGAWCGSSTVTATI